MMGHLPSASVYTETDFQVTVLRALDVLADGFTNSRSISEPRDVR